MAERRDVRVLDAIRDRRHWSYAVPGLVAWSTLALSLVGTLLFPSLFLTSVRLFALYLLVRLVTSAAAYGVGVARCRAWEAQAARVRQEQPLGGDVHHVVIIPNYREPVAVLSRTLAALADQEQARRSVTVVLAMEGREAGACAKARALQAEFADRFAHFLITIHPADLPGEVAGKGANQAWGARLAKRELVDRLGLPIERMTLTSCDADAVFHPHYFAALTRLFTQDSRPHRRIWYAPVSYSTNIWEVPAVIRLLSFYAGASRMSELSSLLSWPLPVSAYTLSFKLADEVGYWDPAVISEDWHMALRCFFATAGEVSLVPIFLRTSLDAVGGATVWQAVVNYYRQQVRHAWGAEDVGYILQQFRRSPDVPLSRRLAVLFWVLHHHALRSTAWFVIALGALVSTLSHSTPVFTLPGPAIRLGLIQALNFLGAVSGVVLWVVERAQCSRQAEERRVALLGEMAAWVLLPVLTFALTTLPGLHAQTMLMLGGQLTFRRTPKRFRDEVAE